MRDLAMFNLAIDSKLRGCDVVALKVENIAPGGYVVDRATVRQKKTGQPVRFELTEQTRQAVDDYLRATGRGLAKSCFPAGAVGKWRCRHGNTPGSSPNGLPASDWTHTSSVRIPSGGQRHP